MAATRSRPKRRLQLDLALQGGGAHGAFTWGVLDRLLEEEDLEISGVSGTSAGAMNAVALASGLMEDGRDGARAALRRLWESVGRMGAWGMPLSDGAAPAVAAPFAAWQTVWDVWSQTWGAPYQAAWRGMQSWWGETLGRTLSPYQLNPLNLNPLRRMLEQSIDFERVRGCDKLRLFIAATHVQSGRLRVFRQDELSADVVLASACLPLLFQAVRIEGQAYWDGGFAGNPSLLPLVAESPAHDLLLVQINPLVRDAVPTSARDILDRMNEVTFNTSLLKELRMIALMQRLIAAEGRAASEYREPIFGQLETLRVHRIGGGSRLAGLGAGSKTDADWRFLSQLHGLGRDAAEEWLQAHRQDLGRRSTVDLAGELLG